MDAANHAQAHVGPCLARAMRTVRTGAGPEGAPEQWPWVFDARMGVAIFKVFQGRKAMQTPQESV